MAFYELRQYKVLPGKMDEWVRIMEQEIIPFQVSKGMVICGSFRGETDDSVYVWLRRFESEAEREAQDAGVELARDVAEERALVALRLAPGIGSTRMPASIAARMVLIAAWVSGRFSQEVPSRSTR